MPSHQPTAVERERAVYLYDRFFPKLCRRLERQIKDDSDASDIAHEVIEYASRQSLPAENKHVENRIFYIARNKMIDWSRRNKPTSLDLGSSEPLDGRTEDPEKVRLELIESVRSAIDSLPKTERECIQLMYYEELGTTQIAQRLGLSAKVVKQALARAHARLHELLRADVSAVDGEGGRT